MNILYYTTDKLHSTKGGTERTSITIASALTHMFNCRCFSVYERPASTPKEKCIVTEFLWDQRKYSKSENISFLRNIVLQNQIECIIVQGAFIHVKNFRNAISGLKCKLIFAHHFQPKWELGFFNFKGLLHANHSGFKDTLRWIRNIGMFPILRHKYVKNLSNLYKEAYLNADNIVLLSREFVSSYIEYGKFNEVEKFRIIPNGLSFNKFSTISEINDKKRIVLIVARLDESAKRIATALRIWKEVKQHSESEGWILKIVGDGPDRQLYEIIIAKEEIPDVIMLGRQNPVTHYQDASIFMMTSKSESWGLTLTEAQQFGVVPIAFNSYESLSDIITDGKDGFIIAPDDNRAYLEAILSLMKSAEKRKEMALKATSSCKRYESKSIASLWWNLINS